MACPFIGSVAKMPMQVVVGAAVCGGWRCRLAGAAGTWGPGCWSAG